MTKSPEEYQAKIDDLRLRLEEAEETLRAIGSGEVDAFVVSGPDGEEQVFTLKGAEKPYRVLVENMSEGAATLAADGAILYCNKRLADLLQIPLEKLIGSHLGSYVRPADHPLFLAQLSQCALDFGAGEITMLTGTGTTVPVLVSCCANDDSDNNISMIFTDLTQQKRNEKLLASENFSTSIVELASEAIIVCDTKGKVIRASQSAHNLCGANPLLQPFSNLFRLNIIDSGELFSLSAHMRKGNLKSIEVEFKREDGQIFNLLLSATIFRSQQNLNIGSIVTLTDITDRKEIENALQQSELRLQSAYSHLQVVNEEFQISNEELQAQSEELQSQREELQHKNLELARLWEITKKSEAVLRESEERLALAISATRIGMFDLNLTSNRILWTQTHEAIFGYTPTTTTTTNTEFDISRWSDRVHPEDMPLVEAETRRCMTERKPIEMQYRIIWPDGSLHWVETKGVYQYDGDGAAVRLLGVVRDITESKIIETALIESEFFFRESQRAASIGSYKTDFTTGKWESSEILDIIFGIDSEYTRSIQGWLSLVYPDDRDMMDQYLREEVIAKRILFSKEYRIIRKNDGETRWVHGLGEVKFDNQDNPKSLIGTIQDITERRRMEDELQKSNAFNQSIIDSSNDCIKVLNMDGRLQFMNLPGQRLLEINDFKPYFNVPYADLWKGSDNVRVNEVLEKAKLGQSGSFQGYCPTAGGTPKWWDVSISPILGASGKPERLLAVSRDITERKQAEDELVAAKQKIQSIIDNTPAIVNAFDLEERFVLANAASAKLLNSTPAQLIGKRRHDFMPQADADWHEANDRKVIETGLALDLEEQSELSGRSLTWLTTKFPLRDSAGKIYAVGGISTNISERKLTENILRFLGQSGNTGSGEDFFHELARYLAKTLDMDFVCIDRLENDNLSAKTLAVFHNDQFEDNVSYTLKDTPCGDVVGKNVCSFPQNVCALFPNDEVLQDLKAESYLGTTLWSSQGKPIGLIAVIGRQPLQDTRLGESVLKLVAVRAAGELERLQAEKTLLESEERFRELVEQTPEGIFVADAQGRYLDVNPAGAQMLGYTQEDICRMGFADVLAPEEMARIPQAVDLLADGAVQRNEWQFKRKDGSFFTGEVVGRQLPDGRLQGILRDVTVHKQAEAMLKHMNEDLEFLVAERTQELAENMEKLRVETTERIQAMEALREKEQMLIQQSRQAAMGEMIGNIAHQWRQPLNTLGLYTQKLGMVYGMPSFNKEFLDNSIAKSMEIIQHMSKTIDDFRDYFKPEKEKTDFYVVEAIKSTLSLLEGNFHSPKITVDYIEHGNPVINGYQNEFAQVFLNILNNARDAIIERNIDDPRITITICSENNCAVVTVTDNAGGIPDEVIDKVFDPYFTTKGPQVGTGIGLFMSKTIIEKNMGGRLTVRNTDTGAEFRIEVEHGTQN